MAGAFDTSMTDIREKPPAYLADLPPITQYVGDASRGEVQIISESHSEKSEGPPGVQFESREYLLVRDAVRYPSGAETTPLRLIPRSIEGGPSGVVVLAHRNGTIYLRRIFRHGTRRWELETPRGRRDGNCTAEQAAKNELEQELGFSAASLVEIGTIAPETALMPSRLPVFWAELEPGKPEAEPEDTEAMGPIAGLQFGELATRIGTGEIACGITLAALAVAAVKGKLSLQAPAS